MSSTKAFSSADSGLADRRALLRGSPDRRASIIRGAVVVFANRGYGGASIRELAAAAGIEKGHLSYYFRTKEDLLFEIVDDLHEQFVLGLESWTQEYNAHTLDSLRLIFQQHALLVFADSLQTRVAYENIGFLSPDRRKLVIRRRDQYERMLSIEIEACRNNGVPISEDSSSIHTKVVLGILNWAYQWYSPNGAESTDHLAQRLSERAVAALLEI